MRKPPKPSATQIDEAVLVLVRHFGAQFDALAASPNPDLARAPELLKAVEAFRTLLLAIDWPGPATGSRQQLEQSIRAALRPGGGTYRAVARKAPDA